MRILQILAIWGEVVKIGQRHVLYVVYAIAVIIVLSIVLFFVGTTQNQLLYKYIVPKDYRGWVEVVFEQPAHPPLERKHRTIVIEVPSNGLIHTSSSNASGVMELYYKNEDGKLMPFPVHEPWIHGAGTTSGSIYSADGVVQEFPEKFRFFVGTEAEWEEQREQ